MSTRPPMEEHPLVRALSSVAAALDDVRELDPAFLPTAEKERALPAVQREISRLEGLRLELLAVAGDVADEHVARSAGAWLAAESRSGSRRTSRTRTRSGCCVPRSSAAAPRPG